MYYSTMDENGISFTWLYSIFEYFHPSYFSRHFLFIQFVSEMHAWYDIHSRIYMCTASYTKTDAPKCLMSYAFISARGRKRRKGPREKNTWQIKIINYIFFNVYIDRNMQHISFLFQMSKSFVSGKKKINLLNYLHIFRSFQSKLSKFNVKKWKFQRS